MDVVEALPPSPMPHRITEILRKEEKEDRGGRNGDGNVSLGRGPK